MYKCEHCKKECAIECYLYDPKKDWVLILKGCPACVDAYRDEYALIQGHPSWIDYLKSE